ncbi:MAG: DciA family protein [Gammaproteobacteria bacterium]
MPHHVLDLLQSPQCDLASILQTVQAIQELSHWIQTRLPEAIRPHCQVGLYQKGILTLVASSPAWATQLRFLSGELLQNLRQEPRWISIRSIQVKVARLQATKIEPGSPSKEEAPPTALPQEAAEAFQALANELDESVPGNEALKAALERLARCGA